MDDVPVERGQWSMFEECIKGPCKLSELAKAKQLPLWLPPSSPLKPSTKMKFFSVLAVATAAQAYITSITLQQQKVSLDSNATVVFNTSSCAFTSLPLFHSSWLILRTDIQNWEDYSAVIGATRTTSSAPSLGQLVVGSIDFVALDKYNTVSRPLPAKHHLADAHTFTRAPVISQFPFSSTPANSWVGSHTHSRLP